MSEYQNREVLNLVVVGHVDHGKSTLIGRLLYDTDSLPQGTIDKVKRIAKETGKPFEYAYLLDAFEEEQKQGITIDTTQIQFQSEKRDFVIIDAPGHIEFLKNMISGAANAEAAFLIIDAKEGVQEQSKRHAYILSLIGIKKVYVIVNKMDLVSYSQETFEQVKKDMNEFLANLNVFPLEYIPVSSYYGENILESSAQLPWYKGETVIEAMDHVEKEKGLEKQPLRLPIQDVYKFDDRRIIAGRIETGTLHTGDEITIYPKGKQTTVKSIEHWAPKDETTTVSAGESVGITVADEFFNERGEVIAFASAPPLVGKGFAASVFWLGKQPLLKGKKYKFKLATQETEGEIIEIRKVVDASNLDSKQKKEQINLNDAAEVLIRTKDEIAFDRFSDNHSTGRFVIVDEFDVAGGGIILEKAEVQEEAAIAFEYGSLRARGDLFEEYYYNAKELKIEKTKENHDIYSVGDEIPTVGKTYHYPDNVDILILRDTAAIKVRNRKILDIQSIEDYEYTEGISVMNGRGFGLAIQTVEQSKELLRDYKKLSEVDFLNKWARFETFRQLIFHDNYWVI